MTIEEFCLKRNITRDQFLGREVIKGSLFLSDLIDYVSGQLNTIFKSDPRITIKNIELYALPDDNALVCISTLLFNEFGIIEDLSIQIKGL